MEKQLVGLLRGRLAIVARHRDLDVVGDDAALDRLQPMHDLVGDDHGVGALALGDGDADGGTLIKAAGGVAGHGPAEPVGLGRADAHIGDVFYIDRPSVSRGEQQQADIGNALQGLAGDDRHGAIGLAKRADEKGAVGVGQLVDELIERHPILRQALRIGLDADLIGAAADDVAQADVIDLGEVVLQFLGDLIEAVVGPSIGALRLRRQRQHDDRHVVDAAADDQRLGNALRQFADIGAYLVVNAQHGVVLRRADIRSAP